MVADLVQSYKAIGRNMSLKVSFLDSHLELHPEKLGGQLAMSTESECTRKFPTLKSGTKASEFPVYRLTVAGHLEEILHRQNGTESHSLLLVK